MTMARERAGSVKRALRLEALTIAWNVVEGALCVAAALSSGSSALLGFGVDSFIESLSAGILVWRLRADESTGNVAERERLERRALRLVGVSFFVLAAVVSYDALKSLWLEERPEVSYVGVAVLLISIVAMLWLGRAKRRVAVELSSRALAADAFQTTLCWWLSVITLTGLALNGVLGWWWADPAMALVMVVILVREGREAWRGEVCDCHAE